jgi:hypothetical protein
MMMAFRLGLFSVSLGVRKVSALDCEKEKQLIKKNSRIYLSLQQLTIY